jgi:hypothetical protein
MPNSPNTFFKYMTAKVAKIVLVNHTLRWSSPLLFNDPFDVLRDFNLGFDIEEIIQPVVNEVTKLIYRRVTSGTQSTPFIEKNWKRLQKLNSAQRDIILSSRLPKFIRHVIKRNNDNSKKQWTKFIPEFRILCLSEIGDNILMCSHYSDSHKGIVLELQPINTLDSPLLIAQPVVYQDSPPILVTKQEWINHITEQKPLNVSQWKFYEPCTLTKTIDWKYEKEWRVVSFMDTGESGLYSDYLFNPSEARAVYLGSEISNEDTHDIISLLKYDLSHVRVYRTKKIEHERKLSFDRIR